MINLFRGVMEGGLAEAVSPSTCVICQNTLVNPLTLADILSLSPIKSPLFCQECMNSLIAIDLKTACKQCGRDMTIESAGQVDEEGFCGDCKVGILTMIGSLPTRLSINIIVSLKIGW